jgi:hypothetical protein
VARGELLPGHRGDGTAVDDERHPPILSAASRTASRIFS